MAADQARTAHERGAAQPACRLARGARARSDATGEVRGLETGYRLHALWHRYSGSVVHPRDEVLAGVDLDRRAENLGAVGIEHVVEVIPLGACAVDIDVDHQIAVLLEIDEAGVRVVR